MNNYNVFLLSSEYTKSSHFTNLGVNKESLRKSLSLYVARSVPKHSWINDQDRYLGREDE